MSQKCLVRIEKDSRGRGILRHSVFGLNVFVANTMQGDSHLLALQDKPVLRFLGTLVQSYETVCLLGSPALDNWLNDKQREGKRIRIEDLLGDEMSYVSDVAPQIRQFRPRLQPESGPEDGHEADRGCTRYAHAVRRR
jgi:hypothetical protein